MFIYEFAANANHRFNVLFVTRLAEGRGGIAGIFNINVRISELGLCESIRIYERDKNMDLTAAGIYDAFSDYWCYPMNSRGEIRDGLAIHPGFTRNVKALIDNINEGSMRVDGTLNHSLAVCSDNAASIIETMKPRSAKILVYADPAQG